MKNHQKDNFAIANTLTLIITLLAFLFAFIGEYLTAFFCIIGIILCFAIIDEVESGAY